MTHTSTDQERAEFDRLILETDGMKDTGIGWADRNPDGTYKHKQIQKHFLTWQAARRAQVVPDEVEKLREELAEEADAANNWRRLALQFDNHRMHAIWHLKHVLHPCGGQDERDHAEEFLKAPPLDGEAVLAERIAAIAAAPQPPDASPVQMPNVDTVGVMLELESRIPFIESQTTRRAMEAAVQLLRILAAHGVK